MTLVCKGRIPKLQNTYLPSNILASSSQVHGLCLVRTGQKTAPSVPGPRRLPRHSCAPETAIHTTQPGQCRSFLRHSSSFIQLLMESFHCYSFYPPSHPHAQPSRPGSRQQVTGSSTVSQSHRAMAAQSRASKTKKQLEKFRNC